MKVKFSPRARADARTIRRWWRLNGRQNKQVFGEELLEARLRLKTAPKLGKIFVIEDGETVRSIPMLKTRCNLYYRIDETKGIVEIMHIWSPVKGEPIL
jgi:plasmid stabilization system protein ParE